MSDYKKDADQFERELRDRRDAANLKLLAEHYGLPVDKAVEAARSPKPHMSRVNDGPLVRRVSAFDVPDHHRLMEPELVRAILELAGIRPAD